MQDPRTVTDHPVLAVLDQEARDIRARRADLDRRYRAGKLDSFTHAVEVHRLRLRWPGDERDLFADVPAVIPDPPQLSVDAITVAESPLWWLDGDDLQLVGRLTTPGHGGDEPRTLPHLDLRSADEQQLDLLHDLVLHRLRGKSEDEYTPRGVPLRAGRYTLLGGSVSSAPSRGTPINASWPMRQWARAQRWLPTRLTRSQFTARGVRGGGCGPTAW